ncbi:hypothetical protein V3481_006589 [Fusarium oxysporum f. sp. vasinfectum]
MVLNRPDRPNHAVVAFIAAPQVAQTGDAVPTILLNDTAIGIARAAIREASITLPDHMKPSTFIVVPSIPKTQSAKANRRALQALVIRNISLLSNISSASFAESSRLRSLGIDSISAIRLVSRLNEAGYSLPVVDVLQCETVRDRSGPCG